MIRSINYTARQKIRRRDLAFTLSESPPSPLYFDAMIDLKQYQLPDDAAVYVEAYHRNDYMRFDFGTVGRLIIPAERTVGQLGRTDAVRFRVKVVAAEGLLVAEADGVRPVNLEESEESRQPLLVVRSAELGDEVWQVSCDDETPTLLINNKVGDRNSLVRSGEFACLAWPAVVRQILTRILLVERFSDTEDDRDWRSLWLRFGLRMHQTFRVPEPANQDEVEDWIEGVVKAFCSKQKLGEQLGALQRYGESE